MNLQDSQCLLSVHMWTRAHKYMGMRSGLCLVQIGRDPRISGPVLAAALAAGLTSKGVQVARFGYATTPAMFMSTISEGAHHTTMPHAYSSRLPHDQHVIWP